MRSRAVLPLLIALCGCDLSPAAVEFSGLELGAGPHLLLDDYLIERAEGAYRVVNSPVRDPRIPNPLVSGTEDRNITPYLTVLREGGRFRLWYNTAFDDRGTDRSNLGYMESPDGIHWERPHRELVIPSGGIRFGASVIRERTGGYLLGYFQRGGLNLARSEAGLVWEALGDGELIVHNHDINSITWDPIRERYIAVISTLRSAGVGGPFPIDSRQTQQSVSEDLIHWETPWDILIPDFYDHEETQFYAMDGFLARGGLLIAMVKVLRDDLTATGGTGGMGWTTLAWSRDGRNWTRDRAIFFGPDPGEGTWDHAHAWIDEQVEVGDSVYLYYGGYASGHKAERATDRQIGLVTIARDRYAGWRGGEGGGALLTRPLRLTGARLSFNVEAPGGTMSVRVLGLDGSLPLGECAPIAGDALRSELRCEREISSLTGPVRLEILLENATLYAMMLDG